MVHSEFNLSKNIIKFILEGGRGAWSEPVSAWTQVRGPSAIMDLVTIIHKEYANFSEMLF